MSCCAPLLSPPIYQNGFDSGFRNMDESTDDQSYIYDDGFPSRAESTRSSLVNLTGQPNDAFSSCSSIPASPATCLKTTPFTAPLNFHHTTPSSHKINSSQATVKRPRGRPRKYPTAAALRAMTPRSTRSKTGCQTCRKRKKKCDEGKPGCNNCQRNGIICEGYAERRLWDSTKTKEKKGYKYFTLENYILPSFVPGVDTVEDKIFWHHYNIKLSGTFTVEGEIENGFRSLLIPPALRYEGLMKAMLYLSSIHLDLNTPYGVRVLRENPNTSRKALQARSHHYYDQIGKLTDTEASYIETIKKESIEDSWYHAKYGQKLCLLLACLLHGSTDGSHREHLRMYMKMYKAAVPKGDEFHAFAAELFQYYIYADELMRHPRRRQPLKVDPQWKLPITIPAPRLLGIADGLLSHLPKLNNIRDSVRQHMDKHGEANSRGYQVLWEAFLLSEEVERWNPTFPAGDKRNLVVKIYKQMMWVYLMLTSRLTRSKTEPALLDGSGGSKYMHMPQDTVADSAPYTSASDSPPGLDCQMSLHRGSIDSEMHGSMPPTPRYDTGYDTLQPRRESAYEMLRPRNKAPPMSYWPPVTLPRQTHVYDYPPTIDEPEKTAADTAACAQQRLVLRFDKKIVDTVDSALDSLGQIKASEPVQVLLLIPCLLLGVAAIEPRQREKVAAAIKRVRTYTDRKTCEAVRALVERVWQYMDEGNWWLVWDWQSVACDMNLDFLPA